MKHKVAVLVENNPGVLAKVANLFSRRGYNIDSLVVSDTEDKAISRMTIVVDGTSYCSGHNFLEKVHLQEKWSRILDLFKFHLETFSEKIFKKGQNLGNLHKVI